MMAIVTPDLSAMNDRAYGLPLARRLWGWLRHPAARGVVIGLACALLHAPRLLVLDWRMPGVEGLEVCRRARQCSGAQATSIRRPE